MYVLPFSNLWCTAAVPSEPLVNPGVIPPHPRHPRLMRPLAHAHACRDTSGGGADCAAQTTLRLAGGGMLTFGRVRRGKAGIHDIT